MLTSSVAFGGRGVSNFDAASRSELSPRTVEKAVKVTEGRVSRQSPAANSGVGVNGGRAGRWFLFVFQSLIEQ